jgi:hypothetical protein
MAKLVVQAPGEPVVELDLPVGIHQVGRSPGAHCQINHPSVSSVHCQIAVEPDGATITDLGSTNGTWMDGERIRQKPLRSGQRLRLGQVDVVFDPQAAPPHGYHLASASAAAVAPGPPAAPLLRVPLAAAQPAAVRAPSFYRSIPGAFVYPLKHYGVLPLAVGSILFLAFNVLPRLMQVAEVLFVSGGYGRGMSLFLHAAFAGSFFGIGTIVNVLASGYIFLFMQTVVAASANGEDRMPMYPPYENWWYDAVGPYFRLLGVLACCLAPAILCRSYLGPDFLMLTQLLGLLGFCYFFMALLAVCVCDSFAAMNPRVVIPSICRIPAEYGVYCLVFVLLTGAAGLAFRWIQEYPVLLWQYPIYRLLSMEFIFLYLTVVEMRLLGLLFFTGRNKLGWRA